MKLIGEALDFDEALALASGGGEIELGAGGAGARAEIAEFADEFVSAVDARLGFATAGLGAAAEPLDLGVDAVFEGFLMARLGVHPLLFHFEEVGVGAGDAENSVGIDAGEFGGFVGYVFQEIAVVGDDDTGKVGLGEKLFEPLDSGEVEVIGGLVEEKDFRGGDERFGDGEALAPASGEGLRLGLEVFETGAAEGFMQARVALQGGNAGVGQRGLDDLGHGEAGSEDGFLRNIGEGGALAQGDLAGVGRDQAGEDAQQGGFAGAVGTDESNAVAVIDSEGDVAEERLSAEGFRQRLGVENRRHLFDDTGAAVISFCRLNLRCRLGPERRPRGCRGGRGRACGAALFGG